MESPVVLDKPPEYHGDRGFPFEDEDGSGAWSELAARHPDIAARLRQRPATATWARKRRPSSQDATDDFGENFSGFDRFPFDDIPPEFREHLPSHWNRRFGSREETPPQPPPQPQPQPQPQSPPAQPQQQTAATQTEHCQTEPPASDRTQSLPQYGLRNTVDLGQRSAAEPSAVDEERSHRSMSAPPAARARHDMSAQRDPDQPSNVRHIPIFVEGRDEPVVHKAEGKQPCAPPPPPPADRDHYFADDGPATFHHPPNFSRAFGTPFGKGFRPGPQPFTQQKAYPQNAFARGASPQRSHSPKQEDHFVKVPVHQEPPAPKTEPPAKPQPRQTPPRQPPPPRREPSPPQAPPKPSPTDPITQILSIQTDVLNLMTEVENFTGSKKDKRYMFLDEMLTRNLIKLDNIETEGKENIRLARKEAIRCIQKCIAVLEAKAEKGSSTGTQEVESKDAEDTEAKPADNGEVEMKEDAPQMEVQAPDTQNKEEEVKTQTETQNNADEPKTQEPATAPSQPSETQPHEETKPSEEKSEEQNKEVEDKPSPKKKTVKKRDKSKDKAPADNVEAAKDSPKVEESVEVMQVDNKVDETEQVMEVDGAASQ